VRITASPCLPSLSPGFNPQLWWRISRDISLADHPHLERRWTPPSHPEPIKRTRGIRSNTVSSALRSTAMEMVMGLKEKIIRDGLWRELDCRELRHRNRDSGHSHKFRYYLHETCW